MNPRAVAPATSRPVPPEPAAPARRRGRGVAHGWALAGYALLSLLLTWPLVTRFTTHVPGDGIDDPALAWNLWWIKARLVDQAVLDIFHVDWMFHPVGINLAFYTLTPLNGLLSVPLQSALGLITANNLLLLSSFVIGGYGAFLLTLDLLGQAGTPASSDRLRRRAAWIAGLLYAFASSKLFYASLGQFNIASSQWIPFCILYVLRAGRPHATWRPVVMAALFLTFQAWAELTYASFLLVFIGLFALWQLVWLAGARDWSGAGRFVLRFALLGLLFAVGISPFLAAMVPALRLEGDFFASGGGFADVFSADLAGYLLPTRLHPLAGHWVAALPFPNDKAQQIFIGYVSLVLAAAGLLAWLRRGGSVRRMGLFWGGMLLLFWWLTLGSLVRWMGDPTAIPGPFELLSRLPFFSGNRYPSRYSVMLMLAVALLAGAGVEWILTRLRRPRRQTATLLLVGLLLVGEHLSVPLPLSDFRTPAYYRELADLAPDSVVLELPTGWRNGARVLGRSDILIMMQQWYQTTHGLRRLGGNTSRNPPHKFQYFTQAPLLGRLIALMNADQAHLQPFVDEHLERWIQEEEPRAAQILDFLGVEVVTLHMNQATAPLIRFVEEALPVTLIQEWEGPDWRGEPSTVRIYQVTSSSAAAPGQWDLAAPDATLLLAEGWSAFGDQNAGLRYAVRPQATLLLDLPADGGFLQLTSAGAGNSFQARLNGVVIPLQEQDAVDDGVIYTLAVPPGVADQPVDRLVLTFDGASRPVTDLAGAASPIAATGTQLPAGHSVAVRSAGEEVGNFAEIWVDGVQLAGGDRGYHLAALDEEGRLLAYRSFDTFAAPQAADAMAAWLDQWPTGTTLAGAVADEASLNLTDGAVTALARFGVEGDLRGRFRWSHAFVGVAGAPAGTAAEMLTLTEPAGVVVGPSLNGPAAYGAFRSVAFAPANAGQ